MPTRRVRPPRTARYKSLFFASLLACVIGVAYSGASAVPRPGRTPVGLEALSQVIPLWVFAALWLVTGMGGIVCVLFAPEREGQTDPGKGTFTFAALFGLYVTWGSSYVVAWLWLGDGRAWLAGGIFSCLAGMVAYATRVYPPMWVPVQWRWRMWRAKWSR